MTSFRDYRIAALESGRQSPTNRMHQNVGMPQYNSVGSQAYTKELRDQMGDDVRGFRLKLGGVDAELARLCSESNVSVDDRKMSIDTRNMFQNRKAGVVTSRDSVGSRSSDERGRCDSELSNRSLESRNSSGRSQYKSGGSSASSSSIHHRHHTGNSGRAGRDITSVTEDSDMSSSFMGLSVSGSGSSSSISKDHIPPRPAKLISPYDHNMMEGFRLYTPKPRRAGSKKDDSTMSTTFRGARLTDANLDRLSTSDKNTTKSYRSRSSGRRSAFSATSSEN